MSTTSRITVTTRPAPTASEFWPGRPTPYRYAVITAPTPYDTSPSRMICAGRTAAWNCDPYTVGTTQPAVNHSGATVAAVITPALRSRLLAQSVALSTPAFANRG